MKPREYATPAAFKAALDQRLRNVAEPGVIARRRQLLVFDRYLARLVRVLGDAATLKGGLVLELRLDRARTTRDIDLRLVGSPDGLLARLQEAGRLDLGDFMSFEVRVDARHPDITGPGVQYEGQRFRAECRLAGMLYGQPFGVDVAFGDPILGEPELITGDDLLAFAGIAAPELRVYPVETHVAEKLHAYTLPRATPSTRVKDLPDLALLGQIGPRDARRLRAALEQTFGFRATHPTPPRLPDPPMDWKDPYAAIAEEDGCVPKNV
ncbi:nucleotidyl transferase AbiEii/AbiGii toxin family protein [Anaeromyxobacter sp. SG66]|uniref:nucleotidyl transferase AbiEii/AbiGii toxin family protein n=1 Tax=Anaeromyxobacter sp. SG66 TaxID=2925410 RepID=UPI001F5692E4|nr:nucleotidyl transferase AbiEii/AbiGii toxin family protein [Anaeromyxobacter sp. SG66]